MNIMNIKHLIIGITTILTSTLIMAEPKFNSDIDGSSFMINVSNTSQQKYECTYTYTYNANQQGFQSPSFNGKFLVEAGVRNIAVLARNVDRPVTKLNFDFKCKEI